MAEKEKIEYKHWRTEDDIIEFIFNVVEYDNEYPVTTARIFCCNNPKDYTEAYISPSNPRYNFKYRFQNGVWIEGYIFYKPYDDTLGIWGDFHYGTYKRGHFEGIMITIPNAPPIPPPGPGPDPKPTPPGPPDKPEGTDDLIVTSGDELDLFPYVYMRYWPKVTESDLKTNFIEYVSYAGSPPFNLLSDELAQLKTGSDARNNMEKETLDYLNGTSSYTPPFIETIDNLQGPIKYFWLVDEELKTLDTYELEEVIAVIEKLTKQEQGKIKDYLTSAEYETELEQVWQSYFALNIILGYDIELLNKLIRTITTANLANVIFVNAADPNGLTPAALNELAYATIILPDTIFPLPPYNTAKLNASPPIFDEEWIEPYALGDLQMVRQRLIRYRPGEIAYIENIMRGEKKTIRRRKRNISNETIEHGTSSDETVDTTDSDYRANLLSEIQKTLADNIVTTEVTNFDTTYGVPNTNSAQLNGKWTVDTKPNSDKPEQEDKVEFARNVLNKTVNRISKNVYDSRKFFTFDETEENITSSYDNTGGESNMRAIYRWLNKVYLAYVVNYGNRLLIEFMIKDPAEDYIAYQMEATGVDYKEPEKPQYDSVTESNYVDLAIEYGVSDKVKPPPQATKTASAVLQNESEKIIEIPGGYNAATAYITITTSGDKQVVEGVIGRNSFDNSSSSTSTITLNNETNSLPVAVTGNYVPYSPPGSPNNFNVSVEVECDVNQSVKDEWHIQTYNTLLEGYEKQKRMYYTGTGTTGRPNKAKEQSYSYRLTERNELKTQCVQLLFERYRDLIGFDLTQAGGNTSPPQFWVNRPRYTQFFEQAFEWNEMVYTFSLITTEGSGAGKKRRIRVVEGDSDDMLFTSFLEADFARVVVPVSPRFSMAVLYYLSSANIWPAYLNMTPALENDLRIYNELKKTNLRHGITLRNTEPWEVIVPTSMVVLQEGNELPEFPVKFTDEEDKEK